MSLGDFAGMADDMLQHTIRPHADGQTVTATVVGEWDALTDKSLTAKLTALLDKGYRNIVVDATRLSFCDSGCLGALVVLHQATAARGGWLRVAAPTPAVRRPIALSGLDQIIQIIESADEPSETR